MKTIVVATDFSDAAHNASLYAVELAKAFNARLILFSAYQQVGGPAWEVPVILNLEEMLLQVQRRLEDEASIIAAGNAVNVSICSKAGFAPDAIIKVVEENNADMIIAGMKKSGKGIRRFFGSTVSALVKKLKVPMIIVPEETTYSPVTTIALANEKDLAPDADRRSLDALRELGERFHAKLYLIRIAKNKVAETFELLNRPFQINRMLRTLDPVYKCIEDKDVSKALNEFNAAYHVDMMALLPHKHSLIDRWFSKSTTHDMIFETPIPLLILPDIHAKQSGLNIAESNSSL